MQDRCVLQAFHPLARDESKPHRVDDVRDNPGQWVDLIGIIGPDAMAWANRLVAMGNHRLVQVKAERKPVKPIAVHSFDGMGSGTAYDMTQCDDAIRFGDVLIVPREGIVGIMVAAWPLAVTQAHGSFHVIDPAIGFEEACKAWSTKDRVDYLASLDMARREAMNRGYPIA